MGSYPYKEPCCLSNDNTQIALSSEELFGFEVESGFLSRLPDQLLLEILIRLPRESACRFKVVCRDWCSLISSSYFISRYINHTRKPFTIVLTLQYSSPTLEYENHIEAVSNHPVLSKSLKKKSLTLGLRPLFKREYKKSKVLLPFQKMEIYVEASCHNLLLLRCSESFTYCVVNLLTRQWVVLPPVPQRHSQPLVIWDHKPGLLCYHDQNNGDGWCRFKLILVPLVGSRRPPGNSTVESSQFSIKMYCSETRQWSVVNVKWYPLKPNSYLNDTPIIAHDRMLHWLNGRSLVSIDPFNDDLQRRLGCAVKLPKRHGWLLLGVCGGHIRAAGRTNEEGNGRVLNVWDLHKKSWFLAHKVVIRNSSLQDQSFVFLAVHPYDTDAIFVMRAHLQMIYLFNMRTDTLEEYRKLKSTGCKFGFPVGHASVVLH